MKYIALITILIISWPILCYAELDLEKNIVDFGPILSIGRVDGTLCKCPCIRTVELFNSSGDALVICTGQDPRAPHEGFNIVVGGFYSNQIQVVPVGSSVEREILERIYQYLDTKFSFEQLSDWHEGERKEVESENERKGFFLVQLLAFRENGVQVLRWLNANYSPTQQEQIIQTPFEELENERDRQAYLLICQAKCGTLVVKVEENDNGELYRVYDCEVE